MATGIYPQGSFDSKGFDTINLGNLNVHFGVPVVKKQGRGIPFTYALSYDSSVWIPGVNGSPAAWTPVQAFGWSADTQASLGYLTYSTFTTTIGGGGRNNTCVFTYFGNWVYHDPFGANHYFPAETHRTGGGNSCGVSYSAETANAVDNSGYTIALSNFVSAVITSAAGKEVVPPTTATGSGTYTDPNGNEIVADGNGHFTDTTGNVALTVAGSAPSPKTFTYTDASGTARAVTMAYTTYTVQTAFGCTGIAEYGPTSTSLVSSLTYPDGSSYAFTYEATPGASGSVTGRIASVTMPQGGVIRYSYSGANQGIVCADGSAAGLTRTMPNDPANSKWTYTRTIASSTASSTDVEDGLNNAQQYTFVQPPPVSGQTMGPTAQYFETSRAVYQGSASGTPLLSRQTCYNGSSSPCATTALTLPLSTIAVTETLNGVEEHGWTDTFNLYGLHTQHLDYDFGGSSAYGALLRKEIRNDDYLA